ncbi:hypothetical protein M5362_07785 [Streptomyces sp. Je 1-79]|uniref:hypothetical protein n=1 Tax=Streptomyces sp. Je 1-79 TaxID=2943847 RepID=UPI0021A55F30|nr:hypothetical protein [Streptomyces sp. Je 1-79]MCT4353027.1 hypothetical protein [Streptomyces sp. Je 1-79]
MSAHQIPAGSLYAAFAVTGALAWTAGGRRRGPYAIAGGLAAVQAALHMIFSAGEGRGTPGHAAMADHAAMGHMSMEPTTVSAMVPAMETATGHSSAGMIAAHALAALVCGLWLARGEAALFALARTVGAFAFAPLRLLLAVTRVPELPNPVRPRPRTRRLHGVVLAHTLSRRGPPRLSVPRATALGAHV